MSYEQHLAKFLCRLWDMKTGTEVRSYKTSNKFREARFYNNDRGVVLAGFMALMAMDLETEEVAYNYKSLIGVSGTIMDILANGTKLVHAGVLNVSVFDINGKDIVSEI